MLAVLFQLGRYETPHPHEHATREHPAQDNKPAAELRVNERRTRTHHAHNLNVNREKHRYRRLDCYLK